MSLTLNNRNCHSKHVMTNYKSKIVPVVPEGSLIRSMPRLKLKRTKIKTLVRLRSKIRKL